jgi:hypothetical protein
MFNKKDIKQIKDKGIGINDIENQLKCFKSGFPFIELKAPAKIENNGIVKFEENEIEKLVSLFDHTQSERDVLKFVPASGAASRMFKSLFSFYENFDGTQEAILNFSKDKNQKSVHEFFNSLKKFAFYEDLKNALLNDNIDIEKSLNVNNFNIIIDYLLFDKGLSYATLPKGLLKFHKYDDGARTAFEEHFVEAANYCRNKQNVSNLHFTISPEYIEKFNILIETVLGNFEELLKVKFDIKYSIQKPSTDTIAVELNNEPFRENDGSLLFRPGGHGALIENLNDLQGDIIFIKNIDNVVPDHLKSKTYLYKKVLAGYLIELQQRVHFYLKLLKSEKINDDIIMEIVEYADEKLKIPKDYISNFDKDETKNYLISKLNRPIRICGMVKNEGEPGGGPFWVNNNGQLSLQIVESSQVDFKNSEQKEIFNESTHFNPVDLVCAVKDSEGRNFNLLNYTDPNTGFISVKSKDERELKALELPGLWNGAMADWIAVFVEVPIITFNPVKTINDLLRKEHQ